MPRTIPGTVPRTIPGTVPRTVPGTMPRTIVPRIAYLAYFARTQ